MKIQKTKEFDKEFWERIGKKFENLTGKEREFIRENAGFTAQQRKVFDAVSDMDYIGFPSLSDELGISYEEFKKTKRIIINKIFALIMKS